ncbi:MAG: hypothetical protein RLZZ214_2800 [Verrucomicrobiota bacterium]
MMKFRISLPLLGLVCLGGEVVGIEPASPPPVFARKNEIKLFVTPENAEQALAVLKLDEKRAVRQMVCFFDTADGALEAQNLILRSRQKDGESGQSTVKLRASDSATELSEAERAIQPEQDWTHENGPTLSRSVDSAPLEKGLVPQVAAGEGAVAELFNDEQKRLVMARMKNLEWGSLRRFGPVEAKVWREQRRLDGFKEKVTIELWHLEKDGRTLEVLEVSANAKAETEEQARALAKQFFGAANAAGLGEPAGQTKTKKVLDFFKPGR